MNNSLKQLEEAVHQAFINKTVEAAEKYQPKLILNKKNIMNVGATIIKQLSDCEEFYFSVAFINPGGIQRLQGILKELAGLGIKGKLITSTYLYFNSPETFDKLLQIPNLLVKITDSKSFHAKGYMFKKRNTYSLMIGSANLTASALSNNTEWNLFLTSSTNGNLIYQVINEFNYEWEKARLLDRNWIADYEKEYVKPKQVEQKIYQKNILNPNDMQKEALICLANARQKSDKALIISATGTGKTYLAAFDALNFQKGLKRTPKILFIAHREKLLTDAMKSFKVVFNDSKIRMQIFNGSNKNYQSDFIFASIYTLAKKENLLKFNPKQFDYIIYDEAHHCGGNTYQQVLNYFKPLFSLGMTATPERTDGFDIYSLFDHNIAYEIRLQRALDEDMLCPFHYYGIEDIEVAGKELKSNEFNLILDDERLEHIISNAKYYGHSGKKVKGLIFVSRNDFAIDLEKALNAKGLRTKAISGQDSNETREYYIKRLESDNEDYLDYIISVDILAEGIDIPCVNQIIMLRPTQSVIVFTQQLGRGLRKFGDKDYLVVLDFIGNYDNNYLIPIALSGDRTYNKDNIRRFMQEKDNVLPAGSSVNFTRIINERIFNSIDQTRTLMTVKFIKDEYYKLKFKLGKIPTLIDFDKYGYLDPLLIFKNQSIDSYYHFLKKFVKDTSGELDETCQVMLKYVSEKLASGKRKEELSILADILNNKMIDQDMVKTNVFKILTNQFNPNVIAGKKYEKAIFIEEKEGKYYPTKQLLSNLNNPEFKLHLQQVVEFGLSRYEQNYQNNYGATDLVLFKKYSYEDVCQLLNWQKNIVSLNIGGYIYEEESNTFPVFINYDKADDIAESINYQDRFISPNRLIAMSKSKDGIDSKRIKQIVNSEKTNTKIYLFVRKNKDDKESKEFYFLGEMKLDASPKKIDNKTHVQLEYLLKDSVREDIYDYIVR